VLSGLVLITVQSFFSSSSSSTILIFFSFSFFFSYRDTSHESRRAGCVRSSFNASIPVSSVALCLFLHFNTSCFHCVRAERESSRDDYCSVLCRIHRRTCTSMPVVLRFFFFFITGDPLSSQSSRNVFFFFFTRKVTNNLKKVFVEEMVVDTKRTVGIITGNYSFSTVC